MGDKEFFEAVPKVEVDILPVIESGAANCFFVERKSERFDEVEAGAGGEGKAASRSGIVRDFWFVENDV